MQLSLVGINHQTAPIAVREKAAISSEQLEESLSRLRSHVPQGVILSTCNRTEIYVTSVDGEDGEKESLAFLMARLDGSDGDWRWHVYTLTDRAAVEHLFRVTSGLESMVVGEYEVLGQAGQCLEVAEKAGMVNLPLRHIFQSAIRAGRRVREETGISQNALSVSSVAVDLAADAAGDLTHSRMLVIGAGEAGRLVAKVARERGVSRIVIASRTRERARILATALQATPMDLGNLASELVRVNIIVTCAGAPHHIIDVPRIEAAMKARPQVPLVIIDIAVPRNVDPRVAGISNVFLYNMDDLTRISDSNRKQREQAIRQVEELIANEVDKFIVNWQDFEVRPVLRALMSKAEEIRSAQLHKTIKKLPPLSDEQQENLEAMTRSIVTRILRDPIQYLKTNSHTSHSQMVRDMFHLRLEERS